MTDEQRAYWQAYVDSLKPLLRLWQWQITVKPGVSPGDGANAATWVSDDYHTAELYFCDEWADHAPADQRETIAHELVHIHLGRINMFGKKLTSQLGGQAEGLADEMRIHFLETATEELARTIAPFLPLPPKVKKAKAA